MSEEEKEEWILSQAKVLTESKQPICKKINPSILLGEVIPEDLFSDMLNILNTEIAGAEIMFQKMYSKITYSYDKYQFEEKLKRKQEMALDIRLKCI